MNEEKRDGFGQLLVGNDALEGFGDINDASRSAWTGGGSWLKKWLKASPERKDKLKFRQVSARGYKLK